MAGVAGSSKAGEQLGEGLATLVLWILTNRFLSFPSFYFAAQGLIAVVLSMLGLSVSGTGEVDEISDWIMAVMIGVPLVVMIVYRKKMPLLAVETVRWILILLLLKLFWWLMTAEAG